MGPVAKPSKREQDLKRRQGGGDRRKVYYAVGAVAVAALVLVVVLQPGAASGLDAFEVDDDPFMGSPEARVALVGYESPHCSACRHFHANILPQLDGLFENGSLVYYFVQGTIMDEDRRTSEAQECAYREGGNDAFWRFTDRLYSRPGSSVYGTPDLEGWLSDLATEQGLDEARLLSCLRDRDTRDHVAEDLRVGREQGVRGTPSFWLVVDGEVLPVRDFGALPGEIAALV